MDKKVLKIKTALHYLNTIGYPCDEEPSDFRLETDYQHAEFRGHSHRHNAIVEIEYDALGRPMAIEITFLGEEQEPQEEQTQFVEDQPVFLNDTYYKSLLDGSDYAADEARKDSIG